MARGNGCCSIMQNWVLVIMPLNHSTTGTVQVAGYSSGSIHSMNQEAIGFHYCFTLSFEFPCTNQEIGSLDSKTTFSNVSKVFSVSHFCFHKITFQKQNILRVSVTDWLEFVLNHKNPLILMVCFELLTISKFSTKLLTLVLYYEVNFYYFIT